MKLCRHIPLALATAALAAACSSGSATIGAGSPSTAAASATVSTGAATASSTGADWPQFDQNAARTGVAPGVPAPGKLATAWAATLDGAVYGQPLVIGGKVIAATENDTIYALSRTTGKVVWQTHVGTPVQEADLPCGNIFPLGITGTPIYSPGNGLVYAVAEVTGPQHVLVGVDAATGTIRFRRALDNPTASNHPANNQQRPALAITNGRVYATFGGLAGDCGAYQGSVVSAPLTGDGPLARWQVPTSREGAIWATGGPVVGPDGNLWVAVGNGAAGGGDSYDGSDSVTELSPALQRIAFFAPSTWADDNDHDLDLGSTQPVLAAGGTVFIMGKRSTGYLLSASNLGGIGGQLAQQDICNAFGTAAVSGSTIYEPCSDGGLAAIHVDAATKTINVLWRGPSGTNGSPVIGGGAVWVTQYSNDGSLGILDALNPATGQVEQQTAIAQGLPHFSSLSLSGSTAYLGTLTGVTAVSGA